MGKKITIKESDLKNIVRTLLREDDNNAKPSATKPSKKKQLIPATGTVKRQGNKWIDEDGDECINSDNIGGVRGKQLTHKWYKLSKANPNKRTVSLKPGERMFKGEKIKGGNAINADGKVIRPEDKDTQENYNADEIAKGQELLNQVNDVLDRSGSFYDPNAEADFLMDVFDEIDNMDITDEYKDQLKSMASGKVQKTRKGEEKKAEQANSKDSEEDEIISPEKGRVLSKFADYNKKNPLPFGAYRLPFKKKNGGTAQIHDMPYDEAPIQQLNYVGDNDPRYFWVVSYNKPNKFGQSKTNQITITTDTPDKNEVYDKLSNRDEWGDLFTGGNAQNVNISAGPMNAYGYQQYQQDQNLNEAIKRAIKKVLK